MTTQDTQTYTLAAIDIGSNAARLLIKDVETDATGAQTLRKRLFLRIPLRLGMDVFSNGKISDKRAEEFVRTIKAYKQLMKVYHVDRYRACATSAMRDAANGRELMEKAAKKTGLALEIISGDEESQIVYDNHLPLMTGPGNFIYVDVGGGSTEVTLVRAGEKVFSHSYNIGTIRLLSQQVSQETTDTMIADIKRVTENLDDITIIGSGGNINKLYRLSDKGEGEENILTVDKLRKLHGILSEMNVEKRMETYNLKPDRADVIVPAASIFLMVADHSGAQRILVPSLGLADGIINDLM